MPRYYFDLLDGEDFIKDEGMELPDIGSAQATSLCADQTNHCSNWELCARNGLSVEGIDPLSDRSGMRMLKRGGHDVREEDAESDLA